jgi:hypothetical protein
MVLKSVLARVHERFGLDLSHEWNEWRAPVILISVEVLQKMGNFLTVREVIAL